MTAGAAAAASCPEGRAAGARAARPPSHPARRPPPPSRARIEHTPGREVHPKLVGARARAPSKALLVLSARPGACAHPARISELPRSAARSVFGLRGSAARWRPWAPRAGPAAGPARPPAVPAAAARGPRAAPAPALLPRRARPRAREERVRERVDAGRRPPAGRPALEHLCVARVVAARRARPPRTRPPCRPTPPTSARGSAARRPRRPRPRPRRARAARSSGRRRTAGCRSGPLIVGGVRRVRRRGALPARAPALRLGEPWSGFAPGRASTKLGRASNTASTGSARPTPRGRRARRPARPPLRPRPPGGGRPRPAAARRRTRRGSRARRRRRTAQVLPLGVGQEPRTTLCEGCSEGSRTRRRGSSARRRATAARRRRRRARAARRPRGPRRRGAARSAGRRAASPSDARSSSERISSHETFHALKSPPYAASPRRPAPREHSRHSITNMTCDACDVAIDAAAPVEVAGPADENGTQRDPALDSVCCFFHPQPSLWPAKSVHFHQRPRTRGPRAAGGSYHANF